MIIKEKIIIESHPYNNEYVMGTINEFSVVLPKDTDLISGEEIIFIKKRTIIKKELCELIGETDLIYRRIVQESVVDGIENEGIIVKPDFLITNKILTDNYNSADLEKELSYGEVPFEKAEKIKTPKGDFSLKNKDGFEKSIVSNLNRYDVKSSVSRDWNKFFKGKTNTVYISEKLHGSQINIIVSDGKIQVSTKGIITKDTGHKSYSLEEFDKIPKKEMNNYYQAIINTGLHKTIKEYLKNNEDVSILHLVGEMIPCQGGFSYGQKEPTLRLFSCYIKDNFDCVFYYIISNIPDDFRKYCIPYTEHTINQETLLTDFKEYAEIMEGISGNNEHIAEGIVISRDWNFYEINNGYDKHFPPSIKILNSKYKV